jgi:hypothetical protein
VVLVVVDELVALVVLVVLDVVLTLLELDPEFEVTWTTGVPDPWPPTESGGVMVPPGLMTVVTVPAPGLIKPLPEPEPPLEPEPPPEPEPPEPLETGVVGVLATGVGMTTTGRGAVTVPVPVPVLVVPLPEPLLPEPVLVGVEPRVGCRPATGCEIVPESERRTEGRPTEL